jgi:hypothetical protein
MRITTTEALARLRKLEKNIRIDYQSRTETAQRRPNKDVARIQLPLQNGKGKNGKGGKNRKGRNRK